jgi:phosphocarrier protein
MVESKIEITNRLGLHARAAAKLVHTAGSFASQVTVVTDGEEVDAKSILGILQLGAAQGKEVAIRCEGADEDEALKAVTRLFHERFGEDQ